MARVIQHRVAMWKNENLLPVVNPSGRPEFPAISQQLGKASPHSRLGCRDTIKAMCRPNQQVNGREKREDGHCTEK
jgi:hypothetical protein